MPRQIAARISPRQGGLSLAIAACILGTSAGCPGSDAAPGPDLSRTRRSDRGAFVATIVPQQNPIPVNQIHAWKLHLATPAGQPLDLDKDVVRVDGLMPEHSHGMATQPRVTRALGGGDYLVEGMKLQMPGWWNIRFRVASEAVRDDVMFDVVVE